MCNEWKILKESHLEFKLLRANSYLNANLFITVHVFLIILPFSFAKINQVHHHHHQQHRHFIIHLFSESLYIS